MEKPDASTLELDKSREFFVYKLIPVLFLNVIRSDFKGFSVMKIVIALLCFAFVAVYGLTAEEEWSDFKVVL